MTVNYPTVEFAFNPIIIDVIGATGNVSLELGEITLIRETIGGLVKFDLQAIAQSLFNKKEFYKCLEDDTILLKSLEFIISDEISTQSGKIDLFWGALQIGEKYNRSKNLTWFKNLPFTFPLFLQQERFFVCETDDGAPFNWKSIDEGKYNLIPDVDANRKAVFYINQELVFVDEFIFKVKTIQQDEVIPCVVNLGATQAGYALFDWGDGDQPEILPVPKSTIQVADDPATGGTMNVVIGSNFPHTYGQPGEYTVTIKTNSNVDAFRFTTLSPLANNEWYSSGEMNNHVTEIIKIQSDHITNASRMFAGVRYGWFNSTFELECPYIDNVWAMFEFFGVRDGGLYVFDINYSLSLPTGFWNKIADKTIIKSATRMYNGSGFLKIERHMLGFSTALTSVIETFRGMPYVGNNWALRTGASNAGTGDGLLIVEEFVKTDVFWDNPNISKFNGCFWFINDWYDNYQGGLGYSVFWNIRADLFKYNVAQDIDISWMFKQANRAILEINLFRHIKNTLKTMDGAFWGSFNYGGNPRVASFIWLFPGWGGGTDWQTSEFNLDYRGACDLDLLIPDALPNVESMVCAFGWRFNPGALGANGMRSVYHGVQCLMQQPYGDSLFNAYWRDNEGYGNWTNVHMPQINLTDFLTNKFPKCTPTSGKHPSSGAVVDGAFACFWDMAIEDVTGQKKASDYNTLSRQSILQEANMIGWDWGLAI